MTQDAFDRFIEDWRKLLDKTPVQNVQYRGDTLRDITAAVDDVLRRADEPEDK